MLLDSLSGEARAGNRYAGKYKSPAEVERLWATE